MQWSNKETHSEFIYIGHISTSHRLSGRPREGCNHQTEAFCWNQARCIGIKLWVRVADTIVDQWWKCRADFLSQWSYGMGLVITWKGLTTKTGSYSTCSLFVEIYHFRFPVVDYPRARLTATSPLRQSLAHMSWPWRSCQVHHFDYLASSMHHQLLTPWRCLFPSFQLSISTCHL